MARIEGNDPIVMTAKIIPCTVVIGKSLMGVKRVKMKIKKKIHRYGIIPIMLRIRLNFPKKLG